MKKNPFLLFPACALVSVPAGAAESRAGEAPRSADVSSVEFMTENDGAGVLGGDKCYTAGWKLTGITPVFSDDGEGSRFRAHFGVSQEIYTPQVKDVAVPPAGSHPYSAWLYAMAGIGWEHDSSLDLLTLRAGVVGPSALGEQVQNGVHRTLSYQTVKGWDSQLRDEPGVDLEWRHTWRFRLIGDDTGPAADLLPRIGYEVGTVRHYGAVGVQFRFGGNLPGDYGVHPARDTGVGGVPVKFARSGGLSPDSCYGFFDLQAEGWVRNMAIDGNMYHGGNGVPSKTFVAQAGFGVCAYWGGTRVALAEYVRTKEFAGQDGLFGFGSLTMTVAF